MMLVVVSDCNFYTQDSYLLGPLVCVMVVVSGCNFYAQEVSYLLDPFVCVIFMVLIFIHRSVMLVVFML